MHFLAIEKKANKKEEAALFIIEMASFFGV